MDQIYYTGKNRNIIIIEKYAFPYIDEKLLKIETFNNSIKDISQDYYNTFFEKCINEDHFSISSDILVYTNKQSFIAKQFIDAWIKNPSNVSLDSISNDIYKSLRLSVTQNNYKLFRGLYFDHNNLKWFSWSNDLEYKNKNSIILKQKYLTSWTVDFEVAKNFASNFGSTYHSLILETIAYKKDVLACLPKFSHYNKQNLAVEQEVILKNGTYKCKLYNLHGDIINIDHFSNRFTNIDVPRSNKRKKTINMEDYFKYLKFDDE